MNDDRRQFIEQNAVALVAERDATIERLRKELRRLNESNAGIRALNRQLAERVAACSELLTKRAERFEQSAYLEGWRSGAWLDDEGGAWRCWEQSEAKKRLEGW